MNLSETGKVGVTGDELEGSSVVACEAHRRLGTDVCDGVVFLSYRHVYEHLLIHYDGISRLDGTISGRNSGQAIIGDAVGSTRELNDRTAVGGTLVTEGEAVGSLDEAGEETELVLEDEKLNTTELILEEEVLRARGVDTGQLDEIFLGGIGVDVEEGISVELALVGVAGEHGEEITDADFSIEVNIALILDGGHGEPGATLGRGSTREVGTSELVGLLDVETLLAITAVESPGHDTGSLVATSGNRNDDIAAGASIDGLRRVNLTFEVDLDVALLRGRRRDAELILVDSLAEEAISHGGVDHDVGLVALFNTGIDGGNLTDSDRFTSAQKSVFRVGDQNFENILGSARRSTSPVDLVDGSAGRSYVVDLVAVLDGSRTALINSRAGEVLAGGSRSIGKSTRDVGLDAASRVDAKVVEIVGLADEATGHGSLDHNLGQVALIVAAVNGLGGLADANRRVIGAQSGSGKERKKLLSTVFSAGGSTNPLEGSDISALVADVVDNVAVLLADGAAIVDGGLHFLAFHLRAVLEGGSALNYGSQLAFTDRRRRRGRGRRKRRSGSRRRCRSGSRRRGRSGRRRRRRAGCGRRRGTG